MPKCRSVKVPKTTALIPTHKTTFVFRDNSTTGPRFQKVAETPPPVALTGALNGGCNHAPSCAEVPPPLAQTRARFWFQDQKCGNTGSPCLDKPVLARGTYCGTQVAGIAQPIVHDYERVSNRPAYTPEYKSTWNYSCSNTLSPILTLPASCTKL